MRFAAQLLDHNTIGFSRRHAPRRSMGCSKNPASARSAITLRIVAALRPSRLERASVRDPTGSSAGNECFDDGSQDFPFPVRRLALVAIDIDSSAELGVPL